MSSQLEQLIVQTMQTENENTIEIEFFQKFCDLYNYIPVNLKNRKDKNYSPEVYQALSKTNSYNIKPLTKQD